MNPNRILIRSMLICLLASVVLFGLTVKQIPHLPLDNTPLKFEGARAHADMTELSKKFPKRTTWSESRKHAAQWLKERFAQLGYEPKGMYFSENIAGRQYTDLENVYAEKRGSERPDEAILVLAHYDVTDTTVEGAMDDASGVGVVLELARIFATEKPRRTLIFLITDSEEFGAFWGAKAFAENFPRANQIVAAASFDFVAPEKQEDILTITSGLKSGYTPLWLRELALDSVRSISHSDGIPHATDFTNVVEHVERAIQIPPADHGALLAAGIPAFNWVGQMPSFAYQMAHYHHTPFDVAEAIRPESMADYGRAAERLVRSVDALTHLPDDFRNSSYWKVTRRFYMEGWAVTLLHLFAFVPFLAFSIARFGGAVRRTRKPQVLRVLRNEVKNIGILLGSLLLGYAIMLLLPALKIIAQYEVFPATQKSLLLYSPNFVAMLLVAGAIGLVYWVFRHTFADPEDSMGLAELRHAVHTAFLAIVILLAFVKNSYLTTLLLLPPAYFWTLLQTKKRRERRIMNALLLLGGSITFIVTVIVLNTVFHIGVAYWYLFLSAAYGLISAYSVVLFFMALTIMIRLFRAIIL